MFGYINVNQQELKLREYQTYRSYYCGLCHELKRRYGRTGQLLLSYDMTFLVMLLTGLYEPEEESGKYRCIPHPFVPHDEIMNEAVSYCADMTVLLACYKAEDDWRDEKKAGARALMALLKKEKPRLKEAYPRQAAALNKWIGALTRAEKRGETNPDIPAGCSGRFLGEIFAWKEDVWQKDLKKMGFYLGKFIYLMDAWDDMEKDQKKNNYNVLHLCFRDSLSEETMKALLVPMMSEAAAAFERLPVLKNVNILRNILYSGVWVRYAAVKNERADYEKSL